MEKQNVLEVVSNIAGPEVLPIVEELKKLDNYNEFILAQELDMEINEVRFFLYKLYKANFVTFTRKKDRQKGIYIYYWTFSPKHVTHQAIELKRQRLDKLTERLTKEESQMYYICSNACQRLGFEEATNSQYKCPECGDLMNTMDNSKTITNLKLMIKELEKDIKKS